MTETTNRKKFDSDICIDGKRIGTMRQISKATFRDSFLYIEVSMPARVFVLGLDNQIDKEQLIDFKEKYPLCKVIVYQPIDFCGIKTTIRNKRS